MKKGFTLLEMVVVFSVILILAGLIIPVIGHFSQRGKFIKTQAELRALDTALAAYYEDHSRFPQGNITDMVAALDGSYFRFDPARLENGGYKDPLGGQYIYLSPGMVNPKGYDLYSLGAIKSGFFRTATGYYTTGTTGFQNLPGIGQKDIVIGQPKSLSDQTIFGNPEPTYDMFVKSALALLRSTGTGEDLAAILNIANIPITWVAGITYVGAYDASTTTIYLNYTYYLSLVADGYPAAYSFAAIIGHEATHVKQHLEEGSQLYNSVEKEYEAFKNEAMIWKELKEQIPDQYSLDPNEEFILTLIESGEEKAKEWIRQVYVDLPEY